MLGFCPFGPDCKQKHLKSVIIDEQSSLKEIANFHGKDDFAREVPKANQSGS